MSNFFETPTWEEEVYKLKKSDPVQGGDVLFEEGAVQQGFANVQAQQLANRTAYLKQQVENLSTQQNVQSDGNIGDGDLLVYDAADSVYKASLSMQANNVDESEGKVLQTGSFGLGSRLPPVWEERDELSNRDKMPPTGAYKYGDGGFFGTDWTHGTERLSGGYFLSVTGTYEYPGGETAGDGFAIGRASPFYAKSRWTGRDDVQFRDGSIYEEFGEYYLRRGGYFLDDPQIIYDSKNHKLVDVRYPVHQSPLQTETIYKVFDSGTDSVPLGTPVVILETGEGTTTANVTIGVAGVVEYDNTTLYYGDFGGANDYNIPTAVTSGEIWIKRTQGQSQITLVAPQGKTLVWNDGDTLNGSYPAGTTILSWRLWDDVIYLKVEFQHISSIS